MLTRELFCKEAKPLQITINGVPLLAEPKEFSTGSVGWHCGGKMTVWIGTEPVKVQIGLNLTVVGSKELAK
jgi:hypothetical protein